MKDSSGEVLEAVYKALYPNKKIKFVEEEENVEK
jgi:hypothetical protein